MQADESRLKVFEEFRPQMAGLAYRMTGSLSDADDIVQEAWLRWSRVDAASVGSPKSYLLQVVTRLCVDQATSARARREVYVGPWLPEPVSDPLAIGVQPNAEQVAELADDLSVALLLVLDRLSPLERAAFLLHDVFDLTFEDIAGVLGREAAACRQLASRARRRVVGKGPPVAAPSTVDRSFIDRFLRTVQSGDVTSFARMLADDAELISDGGGKTYAALQPIRGRDKIVRFLVGIATKFGVPREVRYLRLNGGDGLLFVEDGGAVQTWSIDWNAEGEVQTIYVMRNPDKLARLRGAFTT